MKVTCKQRIKCGVALEELSDIYYTDANKLLNLFQDYMADLHPGLHLDLHQDKACWHRIHTAFLWNVLVTFEQMFPRYVFSILIIVQDCY